MWTNFNYAVLSSVSISGSAHTHYTVEQFLLVLLCGGRGKLMTDYPAEVGISIIIYFKSTALKDVKGCLKYALAYRH